MPEPFKTTRNAAYLLNYHIVWSTKYRKAILTEDMAIFLKQAFGEIAGRQGWELIGLEVMPDHVHLFVSAPPRFSPSDLAQFIKGATARAVFTRFPHLRKQLWGGHLWNKSYYVGSAGQVSAETIRRYIENQKGED